MKKKLLSLIFGLLFTYGYSQKTIENPSFEVTTSGIINISKIEMSDHETKVHIHNTFIPHWWVNYQADTYLKDADTGKKYTIIKVEGLDFKEKKWMPDSGEADCILIFPPLDKGVKKVNYNEVIFGISLSEKQKEEKEEKIPKKVNKWLKKELSKVKSKPLTNFTSPNFFNKKPAKLIGYMKGYDPRLGFKTGIIYMKNNITREDYPIVIQIYEDGRFEAELPLIHPEYTYVSISKGLFSIYIEPEQTLAIILNWEEFLLADRYRNKRHEFTDIEFLGPLAKINQDLSKYKKKQKDYKLFNKQQKEITPAAFKTIQIVSHKEQTESLNDYLSNHKISKKAATILKNENILDNANIMFDFVMHRDYYAKQDTLNTVLKAPIPEDYYHFLNNMNLNDQDLLVCNSFSQFINRFEYCKPLSIYPKPVKFTPEKTLLEYLEENNIEVNEEYEKMYKIFDKLAPELKTDFYKKNEEKFKAFNLKYKKEQKAYYNKYYNNNTQQVKFYTESWRMKDSVLTNTLRLDNNLMYQIAKVRSIKFTISNTESKYAYQYWDELKKGIKNPFLIQEGSRMVHQKHPLTSQENNPEFALTTKLPEGKAKEVFKGIIDTYKGKILFIDFWATSCGPCVAGIKRMKETRKKHENNKDFEFIFITDERGSPQKNYDSFVKEQELKNLYRLSTDEYNYLRQLFKFNGIPRYVVIDKKGDVIDGDFPMHNFDVLLEDILKKHQ